MTLYTICFPIAIGFYYLHPMIKKVVRSLVKHYGYDFVKTENHTVRKKINRKSDDEKLDYYETPTGKYYLPKNCKGDFVANTIKRGNVFDQVILDIAGSFMKKDSIVLDIGANYGQMSILLSKLLGGSCAIYSFEAQEMVFNILLKNLAANNCSNVKPFYNAVYDKNNISLIFPEPDLVRFPSYGSYGIDPAATAGKEVKSITIDSIEFDKPISFMKVDIQGSDLFALKGSVNTIRKHQMPVIFEYEEQFQEEFKTSFQDYVDFVESIDYKFVKTVQDINYLIIPKKKTVPG